ncbi:toll/interleukin-1 receptor domain-containing protein [Sedimenticola selenatireducens]|uniref:toll/interleukin-1 receptor domain-containing protein n=1 Tax=Sedimenticola selenatireducens TaxID=191960 RepID=UPI00048A9C3A|nr:toll/interleukin-1 receptor domain-containing protein [Sedimenticola selenatireducens]
MTDKTQKKLVFISHATPDDNEFALWLSTRLKLTGYQVWSDVTQLFGGEVFWQDIEEAISEYTCKFILVITRTSLSKPGVQREIEYALAAEVKHGLKNFVVPIIIDDSSFGGQPYDLSTRNIIPFRNGWAEGFSRLTERFSRDHVPVNVEEPINIGGFIGAQINPQVTLVKKEDIAVTNWLSIEQYPKNLNFYRIPVKPDNFRKRFSDFPYPWFEYATNLASFCNISDMQKGLFNWEAPGADPQLDINAVLTNQPTKYPAFKRGDVLNKLNYMVADAWSKAMRNMGLHCYTLANGKEAFFFSDDEKFSGMLKFPDMHGVERRRSIIGFSGKNNVFWHFAVEAKALFGYQPKICLIPHIVFTEDGKNQLADKNKMHGLRRGFCRNWWNDRWRDMLLAYLHTISNAEQQILLPVASNNNIVISARPIMLDSPVSIELEQQPDEVQDDENDDLIVVDLDIEEEECMDESL